jgi:hypothetical protein
VLAFRITQYSSDQTRLIKSTLLKLSIKQIIQIIHDIVQGTARDCGGLSGTARDCGRLWGTAGTAGHCRGLRRTAGVCRGLPGTAGATEAAEGCRGSQSTEHICVSIVKIVDMVLV